MIETNRLILRNYKITDLEDYWEYSNAKHWPPLWVDAILRQRKSKRKIIARMFKTLQNNKRYDCVV